MELVGKKFKLKYDWDEEMIYTIKENTDTKYLVTWIEEDGETDGTVYDISMVEEFVTDGTWILE